jgi:hypothetical protein
VWPVRANAVDLWLDPFAMLVPPLSKSKCGQALALAGCPAAW